MWANTRNVIFHGFSLNPKHEMKSRHSYKLTMIQLNNGYKGIDKIFKTKKIH